MKKELKDKQKLYCIFCSLYGCKRIIICVFAVFVLSLFAFFFIPDNATDLTDGLVHYQAIKETALGTDGSIYMNDNNERVIAQNPDGSVRYILNITDFHRNCKIKNIFIDENNYLYAVISAYENGGTTVMSDTINAYDTNGHFVKQLYHQTYDTSHQQPDSTRLYVHNGILEFAHYSEFKIDYYSVDIATTHCSHIYAQNFDTPFLYQFVYLTDNHGYYYIKITGEIGYGIIGKSESALYSYTFNADTSGPHASMLVPLEGIYYCYDLHDGNVLKLNNESGFTDAFGSESPLHDADIDYINVSNGKLCGNSDTISWYMDYDGIIHSFSAARLHGLMLVTNYLSTFLHRIFICIFVLFAIYCIGGIYYVYAGPKSSIFLKLLILLPLILCIIFYFLFSIFRFYQADYAQKDYERIARNMQVIAGSIDHQLVENAHSTDFFTSDAYYTLNDTLSDAFNAYKNATSDVYAEILVENESGVYVYTSTASDGLLMSRHNYSDSYDSLKTLFNENCTENKGTAITTDGQTYDFYAPIKDADKNTIAYLFASTTIEHETTIFYHTIIKLLPTLITITLILAAILLVLSLILGRQARSATHAIMAIADGHLDARIEYIGNDEIGHISRCVNAMAASLQASEKENIALTEEVRQAQVEVIATFAEITEAKSGQTGHHVKRVSHYTQLIAKAAGYSDDDVARIGIASMMHDVGKLLIPSEILEKPGRLTPEEFEIVKMHSRYGEQLLHNAPGEIMAYARIIALEHHERYDGTGYPDGKAGEAIHRVSRMVSIADVFDALVSHRSYKNSWSLDDAFHEIELGRGTQFDPELTDIFLAHKEDVSAIHDQLSD